MPVRIGFIGAGASAQRHARALSTLDNVHIAAVYDIAPPRATQFGERFEAEVFPSPTRLLAGEKLDALYICTPPHARGPVEIATAKAGIALFIEAPIALNLRTAQSVQNAIQKSGVLCAVGHPWRYFESTARLRREFSPKNAPKPHLLSGQWLNPTPNAAWKRDLKLSGGIWCAEAYPLLDLTRYLGGEVKKASAMVGQMELKQDFPDATTSDIAGAILQLQSGALVSLGAASLGEVEGAFCAVTKEAAFRLREGQLETHRGVEVQRFNGVDDAFLECDLAFLRAVEHGKRTEIRAPYADAIKTLRLALTLQRASLGSKSITL